MKQPITEEYRATIQFIRNLAKFGINLGLGRIETLLAKMHNPQESLNIIHIGGTNGKGSTAAVLASVLSAAGYRAGMFISPHLHDYRERITINGEQISQQDVVKGIRKMKPYLQSLLAEGEEHPTEFEISTALAFWYFAEKQPDFVLLEVGLGGEIDSTNVVKKPLVSVITSIGIDHMDYLGNTIEEIAAVKAGIIKKGAPVVTSVLQPQALGIIEQKAAAKGVELIKVGEDVKWNRTAGNSSISADAQRFDYYGRKFSLLNLELSLYGEHQLCNASTALAVCEILYSLYGFEVSEQAVRQGLKEVYWPGRQELISFRPKILLDAAHNADGSLSLAQSLTAGLKDGRYDRDKLILCLGILGDKEAAKIVGNLAPLADQIVVTKPNSPRAQNWRFPAEEAEKYISKEKIKLIKEPVQAVHYCLEVLRPEDMLCVTGSIYLLSEVRKYLLNNRLKN